MHTWQQRLRTLFTVSDLPPLTTDLSRQLSHNRRPLLLTLLFGFGALLLVLVVAAAQELPIAELTRDPLAIAGRRYYIGFLSNLGILIWGASAGMLTITAWAIFPEVIWRWRLFLPYFALVTWVLVIDDLFMVHEQAYQSLLPGPELVLFVIYGAMVAAGLIAFNVPIRQETNWLILLLALGCFGLSLMLDRITESVVANYYLFEDGSKFLGILMWTLYFGQVCLRRLKRP